MLSLLLAATLAYLTPQGWQKQTTTSPMRVAEFALPRADGDIEDAQLVLYYFGGSGGSVDANLQRWVAQMQQPDGRPSSTVAKKATRTVNKMELIRVVSVGFAQKCRNLVESALSLRERVSRSDG